MQPHRSLPCSAGRGPTSCIAGMTHLQGQRHIIMQRNMPKGAAREYAASVLHTCERHSHQRRSNAPFSSSHSSRTRLGRQRHVAFCATANGNQQQDSSGDSASSSISSSSGSSGSRRRHVLVLGGTGRVGSGTAASLMQVGPSSNMPWHRPWLQRHAQISAAERGLGETRLEFVASSRCA